MSTSKSKSSKSASTEDYAPPEYLPVGKKAPAFTAVDQSGDKISLSDYLGQKVALCFYVHDGTKGCDTELANLQSNLAKFKKEKVAILAVSQDDQEKHAENAKKLKIKYPLLADPKLTIIKKYKVWGKKNMYGNISEGVHRSAYIIDEQGVIAACLKRVTSTKAPEQIQAALDSLKTRSS